MAMKKYSAFPKAPALLKPHSEIVLCYIQDTHWEVGNLIPMQRCSRCILQPLPTGLYINQVCSLTLNTLYINLYIYINVFMYSLLNVCLLSSCQSLQDCNVFEKSSERIQLRGGVKPDDAKGSSDSKTL